MKRFFVGLALFCFFAVPSWAAEFGVYNRGEINLPFSIPDNVVFLTTDSAWLASYYASCYVEIGDASREVWENETLYVDFGQPVRVAGSGLGANDDEVSYVEGIVPFVFDVVEEDVLEFRPHNTNTDAVGTLGWETTTCFGLGEAVTIRDEENSVLATLSLPSVRSYGEGEECIPNFTYVPVLSITSSGGILQTMTWKIVAYEGSLHGVSLPLKGEALVRDTAHNVCVSDVYDIRILYKDGSSRTRISPSDCTFQDGDVLSHTEDLSSYNISVSNVDHVHVRWHEDMIGDSSGKVGMADTVEQTYRGNFYFTDMKAPVITPTPTVTVTLTPLPHSSGGDSGCSLGFGSFGVLLFAFPLLFSRRKKD